MASKKPNQDPPVDPPDYNLAYHLFIRGTEAALEAEDYTKLQHALEVIVELRRRYPNAGGLVKFHAGISNMCASMATNPQDIDLHRQTAIACARDFVRCDPTSIECAFYLAYFHKTLSYDALGLNQAIEECNRGILLANSNLDSRNWTHQLHGFRAQCEAKLEILKQDKHRQSQLGQRNLQKRKAIFKLEQPVNTQPQEISDLDVEKIRRLVSSLPTGQGLKVTKTARASSQEEKSRSQAIDVHKKLDSDAEKNRRLVSSLPTGQGLKVIETARASSQEEQSRPQAIDVHVMSREVPVLFFEHVRLDMAFMHTSMNLIPDVESEDRRKVLLVAANLKYFLAASYSNDIPSCNESSS